MAVATSSIPSIGGSPLTSSKAPTGSNTPSEEEEENGATTLTEKEPSVSTSSRRRPMRRPTSAEFLSDKATAALIRRTLCARQLADRGRSSPAPIEDLLPPLTSRNDVDLQLYALISIVIREFVQNWYNRITPDETFVTEIVQVIAHCTRALEQRLRKVDLESLLFDELPELLAAHVRAYRVATIPTTRPPLQTDSHQIYHSLCPIPALSPVPRPNDQASVKAQADNESAYRQLMVQGVLAVLLPTEDLENEGMTALVGQLLSELVIGNLVAGKLSEPWLIWEILIMITRLVRKDNKSEDSDIAPDMPVTVKVSHTKSNSAIEDKQPWSLPRAFWSFVHWVFLIVGMIRLTISLVALSWSLPPRSHLNAERPVKATNRDSQQNELPPSCESDVDSCTQPARIPLLDFHVWQCIGDILEIHVRMPWLQGILSMMQWATLKGPGAFDGTLDRLMSHYVHVLILDPAHMPGLLRATRAALFPNNAPGVSSLKPPSSKEQLLALRRRCASNLLGLVPKVVGELYYGTDIWVWANLKTNTTINESGDARSQPLKDSNGDKGSSHIPHHDESDPVMPNEDATLPSRHKDHRQESNKSNEAHLEYTNDDEARRLSEIETGIVDLFSDAYYNKHLVYGILELVLVRLVPELAERGVGELWEERMA
ncbi:PXA domain-containing protein [Xylaria intraflava]|nr:PXA domain-containing protein [Xylaria intraflava]